MKTALLFFGLLAATCSVHAVAQTAAVTSASAAPSHLQAAETLLRLTSSAEAYNQGIDQKLAMMFKQFPDNSDREGTQKRMRAFMAQYLSWESILPELTNIYARHFTETELHNMIAFYQTPTGKKLVTLLPELSQARMDIGQRRLREHQTEFEQLFQKQ